MSPSLLVTPSPPLLVAPSLRHGFGGEDTIQAEMAFFPAQFAARNQVDQTAALFETHGPDAALGAPGLGIYVGEQEAGGQRQGLGTED